MKNKKGILIGVAVAIIAIVAAFATVVILNGGKLKKEDKDAYVKQVAGKYELIELESSEGKVTSKEDIETIKSFGFNANLQLNEDKTGSMELFGKNTDLTFDKETMTADGDTISYTVDGNVITMTRNNEKLVFEKVQ